MNRLTSLSGATIALALAGLIVAAAPALAAPHVRGTVTAIEDGVATVDTTAGETVEVDMAPDFTVMVFKAISIDDVKPDDYLSIPSVTAADGGKEALAINVFPEAMKGTAEGVSEWDIAPDSEMTNATVGKLESQGGDHTIVVSYNGEDETVSVPQDTPITTFGPDPSRTLAVGDKAVFFGKEEGGRYSAGRAAVAQDGSLPPI